MKKYLMTGIAALALCVGFTSCSHDLDGLSQEEMDQLEAQKIVNTYQKAFKAYIGGEISPTQTWGFGPTAAQGRTRSGNTSGDYTPWPSTHQYYVGDKLVASANMNHNQWGSTDLTSMPYGGWIVPDTLTDGQKLRVRLYFQSHPNLSYKDPEYANFYVQQVYTGGTNPPETGNKEVTVSADGKGHKGMTLNQLTVGQAASHINDFNAGTCTSSNVLNHEGKTYNDQITLMLNVDDTSCFGFHETSGSNVNSNEVSNVYNHNDKMALVSAAVIDKWATDNGIGGDPVVDKWNRSFMGFDYELLPESDIVTDDYAMLRNWDGNLPQYAWDGTDVMVIGSAPEATEAVEKDITSTFALHPSSPSNINCSYDDNGNILCEFTGRDDNRVTFIQDASDWCNYDKVVITFAEASPLNATITCNNGDAQIEVGDTEVEFPTPSWSSFSGPTLFNGGLGQGVEPLTLKIQSVKLVKEAPDSSIKYYTSPYLLAGGTDQICFYSTNTNMYGGVIKNVSSADMTITVGDKTCINLKWIKEELYDKGYHPISTDLKTWVKWQAACDGYYSDWIVTLTEAQRIGENPNPTPNPTPDPTPNPTFGSLRIMAEDLSATDHSDFDFNDVVFDVEFNTTGSGTTTVKVWAAGGTLPLRIALYPDTQDAPLDDENEDQWQEIHELWGEQPNIMINTDPENKYTGKAVNYKDADGNYIGQEVTLQWPVANETAANGIVIKVKKGGKWIPMTANQGEPAAKFAVATTCPWLSERTSIKDRVGTFADWAQGKIGTLIWY